ncbi:AJAP1 protein, partial [Fregata magnificens]|nr:AJAP1 protein [Fregata magnificens]
LSVHRSSCPLGSHAWILIAMFHLAMDLASCQPPASGAGGRLSPRPALRHRLSRGSLWGAGKMRRLRLPWPAPARAAARRASLPDPAHQPLPVLQFVSLPVINVPLTDRRVLGLELCHLKCLPRSVPLGAAPRLPRRTRPGWLRRAAAGAGVSWGPLGSVGARLPSGHGSRRDRPPETRGAGPEAFLLTSPPASGVPAGGLAVHQIITITVSLIMVIAALITTLVLKNCCAQSGRPRRNSHQRKLDQQEESCQNLTDFAPARVPSTLDIFTAYNETLQCSHECVRTPVPVYAEEVLHSPGDYKTTFNGNRPSSSDRHLIPVAFVSEKWFEISC